MLHIRPRCGTFDIGTVLEHLFLNAMFDITAHSNSWILLKLPVFTGNDELGQACTGLPRETLENVGVRFYRLDSLPEADQQCESREGSNCSTRTRIHVGLCHAVLYLSGDAVVSE